MFIQNIFSQDPTAAHYKYHDDPYLIPMSIIGKRSFAMAQESGRKSAKWVLENDRKFFNHSVADPPIEAFMPQMVFSEESKVDEENLKALIRDVEVRDSILVYDLLKKQGVKVSEATKLNLMQLLCFYNHEDTLYDEWVEERWFRQGMKGRERQRKTWKDGELAEHIFADLETKDTVAYCTMIRGMCKFCQVDRAYALFQEALDKGIQVDVGTFNSLLSVVNFIKESADLRWDMILDILRTMKDQTLKPNLGTLNAILQTISTMGASRQNARGCALRTLGEFKKLGIEPSLGSWYFILITFCKERGPVSHVLVDIMNQVEGKSFEIQDPKDTFFFVTAMDVCRNHLNDKHLAKRIDMLLHTEHNYNLIGDSYKESIYYRNFLALLCLTEPLDAFMETYHRLVPNIYTPEPGIMSEILKAIDVNGGIEYVPLIWSHMVIFDHANRENLLTQLLQIMIQNAPDSLPMIDTFSSIAFDMWKKLLELQELRVQQIRLSGQILGDILLILARGGALEQAAEVFVKIDKSENELIGEPTPDALELFANLCITEKQPTLAISVLQYMVENGYAEAKTIGDKLLEVLTLDEVQRAKVMRLLGKTFE